MNVGILLGAVLIVGGLIGVTVAPRVAAKRHGGGTGEPDAEQVTVYKGVGVLSTLLGFGLLVFSIV